MFVEATVFKVRRRATSSSGYEVGVFNDNGKLVAQYSASGNIHDSHQAGIADLSSVKRWARTTAIDMFEEKFKRKPKRAEISVRSKYMDEVFG